MQYLLLDQKCIQLGTVKVTFLEIGENLLSVKLAFAILQWSVLIRRSNVTALLHSQRVHYEKICTFVS